MATHDDDQDNNQPSKAEQMNSGVEKSGKKWPTPEEAAGEAQAAGAGESDGEGEGEGEEKEALEHPTYEGLEGQLTETEQKVNEYWNEMMRAKAEMENIQRRAERDVSHARKFALEKFLNDLLPVIDSLGHALDCEYGDNEFANSIHEGVDMTMNMLMQTMEKYGVKVIDPQGEAFDPTHHEAIGMEEGGDVAANTVIKVMQKGYLLNDRLVRPAMVVVAK